MITILVVADAAADPAPFALRHPSVEILVASGAEDAIGKLSRNRRIDAVLILAGGRTAAVAAAIREEDPGAPPLYAPASAQSLPGIRRLGPGPLDELLERLVRALSADG